MSVETATDRAAMLADFGVTVVYGAYTFTGIYDKAYVETAGIADYRPTVTCRSSDVTGASVAAGGAITVDGTSYTVVIIEPDGTGFTTLVLEA